MNKHSSQGPFYVVIALFGTFIMASPCRGQSAQMSITGAVEKARDSIVAITLHDAENGQGKITGTGVIIDNRGFLITNRHVVQSFQKVHVFLADGSEHVGQVLVADPKQDLAIVYIKTGRSLQSVNIAPYESSRVGASVIAFGHPLGYSFSVSSGIISAKQRTITMPTGEKLNGLLQTDASINPGNSGGALLNLEGELVGINVAIRDGAQGIAFAINSDTVKAFLRQYIKSYPETKEKQVANSITIKREVTSGHPEKTEKSQPVQNEKVAKRKAASPVTTVATELTTKTNSKAPEHASNDTNDANDTTNRTSDSENALALFANPVLGWLLSMIIGSMYLQKLISRPS